MVGRVELSVGSACVGKGGGREGESQYQDVQGEGKPGYERGGGRGTGRGVR